MGFLSWSHSNSYVCTVLEQIHKMLGNYKSLIYRLAYIMKNLAGYLDVFLGHRGDMEEVNAKVR